MKNELTKNFLIGKNATSRNNYITWDVRPSHCCAITYVAIGRKSLEAPILYRSFVSGILKKVSWTKIKI